MKVLYVLLVSLLLTCTKERSCEGCYVRPADTIPVIDTLPYIDTSRYFVYFDTLILNNNDISHISLQVLNNRRSNFWAFEILTKVEDEPVWRYSDNVEVTWLMETMPRGGKAYFRMAVVYRINGIPNYREEFSPIIASAIKK